MGPAMSSRARLLLCLPCLLPWLFGGCTATGIAPMARQHNALGAELLSAGDLERAEANFRLALEYAPGLPEARMNLGVLALHRGRLLEAETELRAALGLREDFPEAWANLGAALEAMGRSDEARSAYERALSIHPGLATARRNLGRLLLEESRLAEARAHLLRLLETDPEDLEAHALLAWCELLLDRPDAAEERLAWAFRASPAPPVAHLVRAILELRSGALAEAEVDLALAEEEPLLQREVALRRAAIDVVLSRPADALARLGPLLEDDPFDAAAHLLVARAAADLGDGEVARTHAEAALELMPDLEAARALLAALAP